MSDEIKGKLMGLALIIAIGLVMMLGSQVVDHIRWNNGRCSCGGRWVYVQAVGHQTTTGYLYECDECGKTREFDKKR